MEIRSFSGITKTVRFRWLYLNRRMNEGDDFFIEDGDIIFDPYPPKEAETTSLDYSHNIGDRSVIYNQKWIRLRKLNNWIDKKQVIGYNMEKHFELLIRYFDISSNKKNFIKKEVLKTNPKTINEVIIETFKSIVRNNFPITTKEFRKTIRKVFKIGKETFKDLYTMKRDYTWYINKVLSNLDLSPELHYKLYIKVKENFEILDPIIQSDPTTLISVLCRLSYKALGLNKDIPKLELFLISNNTYKRIRDILKEMGIKLPKGNRRRD